MIAVRTVDLRNDFKRITNMVSAGERVLIARPKNQNVVLLSEKEYNELEKAKRNTEYLAKIDRSVMQIAEGKVVIKTMKELEDMAK